MLPEAAVRLPAMAALPGIVRFPGRVVLVPVIVVPSARPSRTLFRPLRMVSVICIWDR